MKKAFVLLTALLWLLGISASADGVLVMATNPEFPPFEYMEGENIEGLDVDLAIEIAKDLGMELFIESMAFDSIIAAVKTLKADVGIAGMSITDERLNSVDFSVPYFDASQVCIIIAGSGIASNEDLMGKKVGVQLGTTGDIAASEMTDDVVRYQKGLDAILELQSNKLDAVVLDKPVAENILKSINNDKLVIAHGIIFEEESYAIAVAKNRPELLESINNTIARIYADGTMELITAKYFGD